MIVVQRTAIEDWQKCRRKRWWSYEWGGTGLAPVRKSSDLYIGIAVHEGLAALFGEDGVSTAVEKSLITFNLDCSEAGIVGIDGSEQDMDEARALIEALVRGWAAIKLPEWLRDYDILEVEREESMQLAPDMTFLTRTDAIVQRKGDGTKFLVNFKTARECDMRWREQWKYDTQPLSEVLPVEARLGEKLGGVIIEGLVKGGKEQFWSTKAGQERRTYSSPLIWPWVRRGEPPMSRDEYKGAYEWVDADGKNRRLGKGWDRVPIWKEPGGVKRWVEWLLANDRALVEQQFVTLPAILRSEWEIEEWKATTVNDERDIHNAALRIDDEYPLQLATAFPRETSHANCTFPTKCPMFELCWGTAGQDPIGSGLFTPRQPNHPAESELRGKEAV